MIEIKVKEKTQVLCHKCSQEALDSFGYLSALKVAGSLDLWRCTGITKLPEGLKVNGYLDLENCIGLTKLPDGLKVGGYLDLIGCTGITKLPDGLKAVGHLDLENCTGITKLPDDLHVGEEIWYNSKTGFCGHEHEPGVIPERLKHKLKKY